MSKVAVVFWSGTGNTAQMAQAVVEGASVAGAEATLINASQFSADDMDKYDSVAFGLPFTRPLSRLIFKQPSIRLKQPVHFNTPYT